MAKKSGTPQADTLTGTAKADELFGLGGNDILIGLGGNDYLDGGAGKDDLRGGAGNDIYIVDNAGDINKALKDPGHDTVGALINYTLGPQQEDLTLLGNSPLKGIGNALANHLNGNDASNILIGLGGDDVLDGHKGIDDLRGGAGNDLYFIDNAHDINKSLQDAGSDQVKSTVSYTLGNFQESLVLLGKAALAGGGNAGDNFLLGNDGANILHGNGGGDVLDGGKGNDQLFGDAGDDTLYGFAGHDVLHGGAGNDLLYGLDDADNLQGDAGNDKLFGGNGNDVLTGGDGNDFLSGEQGVDVLHGGNGDDTYLLDGTLVKGVAIDTSAEIDNSPDAGNDTVQVNFDYTLGANQENIQFYGTTARHGVGNGSDNIILGTNAAGDELFGMGGNDTLDGRGGADHLVGGEGNDTYFIDNANDINGPDADPGTDTVNSSITYTLLANQENLTLLGSAAIDGTGNNGGNFIVGNSGVNVLHGGLGNDEIIGNGGADSIFGDGGDDFLHYDASAAHIDGGAEVFFGDTLFFSDPAANSTLDLTQIADTVITGIEKIQFASSQAHTLVLNASDLLALSDTSDTLVLAGEADDAVHMTGGGWSKDNTAPVQRLDGLTVQGYSNGSAHLLIDTDILQANIVMS
jgi:Ca2+-binding RTX toxin-like protein